MQVVRSEITTGHVLRKDLTLKAYSNNKLAVHRVLQMRQFNYWLVIVRDGDVN